MKKIIFLLISLIFCSSFLFAEYKMPYTNSLEFEDIPSGGKTETIDKTELANKRAMGFLTVDEILLTAYYVGDEYFNTAPYFFKINDTKGMEKMFSQTMVRTMAFRENREEIESDIRERVAERGGKNLSKITKKYDTDSKNGECLFVYKFDLPDGRRVNGRVYSIFMNKSNNCTFIGEYVDEGKDVAKKAFTEIKNKLNFTYPHLIK